MWQSAMTHVRRTTQSPITSTSILVRKKQSSASAGVQTTGSFSLKLVFSFFNFQPASARKCSELIGI